MTHTEQLEKFENTVGLKLQSSHTREFHGETFFLRVLRWESSNRKSWVMWSEKNGKFQRGTETVGHNLSQETKDWFGL
jgi:hypothetical protein